MAPSLLLLFVLGIAVGSFFNVVIWRYKPGGFVFSKKVIRGRSKCPHCRKKLRWFELVPLISFFIQGGKCRKCGHSLSWQYPVVEFVSGAIFAIVPWYLYNFYSIKHIALDPRLFYALAGFWVLAFLTWLLISVIDVRYYLVPNVLTAVLAGIGVFIMAIKYAISGAIIPFHSSFLRQYALILSPTESVWLNHIGGAVVAGLFFALLIVISHGKGMGWGDMKLALASGLVVGWPEVGLALLLAFILGGVTGGVLLFVGKKSMHDRLPFAPFIIGSLALSVFFGASIVEWYIGLFGI